ncbi:hypothetical protein [Nostoc sp.]
MTKSSIIEADIDDAERFVQLTDIKITHSTSGLPYLTHLQHQLPNPRPSHQKTSRSHRSDFSVR